ncbi:MAG: sulfite exporter TauE/SafE family protein [Bacteroidia bacterium]|jgi:uncharacterized membrane protein YfcA
MEYVLICSAALIGSGLTFFSGFGLGTLLTPVFALFFPLEIAIMLTAVVHFLNNLFKLLLVGRHADRRVAKDFGIPALLFAFVGAYFLFYLGNIPPLFDYAFAGRIFYVMPINLIIAAVLFFFALFEIIPSLANLKFSNRFIILGGALSGFFGGLSGTQGALRSAFLINANLSKEAFIATGVVIACMIDVSRLVVYGAEMFRVPFQVDYILLWSATLSAFVGAFIGSRLLKKVTIKTLQLSVAVCLCIFAVLLGAGIL